jgi:hypothetical protein
MMLLPNPKLVVTGGKDTFYYAFNPASLGKFVTPTTNYANIVQRVKLAGNHVHTPVYWNGPSGPTIYHWGEGGALAAYRFNGTMLSATPATQYTGDLPTHPGGGLSLSSNGVTPGTGVLWATFTSAKIDTVHGGDAWHNLVPGAFYAFDANNLTMPIWSSLTNKARDDIGILAKFNCPVVANGKVYLGTRGAPDGGKLLVYGLLP